MTEEKQTERKQLTRADVLERLKECWELLDFGREELSKEEDDKIQYNLKLADLFSDLQGAKEISSVNAIGFEYEEESEEYEEEERAGDAEEQAAPGE